MSAPQHVAFVFRSQQCLTIHDFAIALVLQLANPLLESAQLEGLRRCRGGALHQRPRSNKASVIQNWASYTAGAAKAWL